MINWPKWIKSKKELSSEQITIPLKLSELSIARSVIQSLKKWGLFDSYILHDYAKGLDKKEFIAQDVGNWPSGDYSHRVRNKVNVTGVSLFALSKV